MPGDKDGLWRAAQALNRRARLHRAVDARLPPLLFVTDPARTPDPATVADRLPAGAGVIYRGFGRPEAADEAARLRAIADRRGLILLVGLDAGLAEAVGGDGVHLPQRALAQATALRAARPDWLLTGAAHDAAALATAATVGLHAALVSPVLPSASPSAGAALGVARFSVLARDAALPVYALGGVTAATADALAHTGAAGLAAIEGVMAEFGG